MNMSLEQMLGGLGQALQMAKAKEMRIKAFKSLSSKQILSKLQNHQPLPLRNEFSPGDIVTQVCRPEFEGIPGTDEQVTRYAFPLPGHPAIVDAVVLDPSFEAEGSSTFGYNDIVIRTFNGMVVSQFVVSSRYFRKWDEEKDAGIDPIYMASIEEPTPSASMRTPRKPRGRKGP
jgi:hypothetical protein